MVELSLIDFHAYWLPFTLSFTISFIWSQAFWVSSLIVSWARTLSSTQEIILFKLNCFILAFFTFIVGKCNVFPLTCHVSVNICLIIAFFESTYENITINGLLTWIFFYWHPLSSFFFFVSLSPFLHFGHLYYLFLSLISVHSIMKWQWFVNSN